ncbi:MAG: hypothetical protein HYY13_01015 [Nitrospirae bacterium]|nr:hypothetical protein [Nitrospirota bacterium]
MAVRHLLRGLLVVLGLASPALAEKPAGGPAADPAQTGRIVDGIVAKVNGEPVFLRDLRVEYWLREDSADRAAEGQALLDAVVDRRILVHEARRLKYGPADPDAGEAEAERLRRRLATRSPKAGAAIEPSEVLAWVRAEMAIRELIDWRVEALISASEFEIEEYHAAHRTEIGEKLTAEAREKVRRNVRALKFDRQYREWFNGLKRRSRVEKYLQEAPWDRFDFRSFVWATAP